MKHVLAIETNGPPRLPFVMFGVLLCIGCAFVPVDSLLETTEVPRFSARHYPFLEEEIIFSHETHSSEPCETCHFDTAGETDLARLDMPSMALCFTCHDGDFLTNDCIACHVENRKERKPRFHDAAWPERHRTMAYEEAYKCSLCHLEKDCQGCHMLRAPRSHTPRFNRSTHGRMATHDRRACATCHQSDFCENCHSQQPPDHTPAFIGDLATGQAGHKQAAMIRGRSCLVCHSFADACARCHE